LLATAIVALVSLSLLVAITVSDRFANSVIDLLGIPISPAAVQSPLGIPSVQSPLARETALETFLAQAELDTGAGLPELVKEEFDAFLAPTALPQARQMSLQPFLHKKCRLSGVLSQRAAL
jgi:hypothetical protein